MNLKEEQMKACPDCGAEPPDWYQESPIHKWSSSIVGPRWHCKKCDGYLIIMDVGDAHQPELEDDVYKWLKQVRDELAPLADTPGAEGGVDMLNLLMDQYRSMAVDRIPLSEYRRSSLIDRSGT